ncbi:raffinose/stachyose/melibiose transport system substrate-binding protein [Paenibacillus endophyticus]|uniref:Raffinose/stachyose/melibiose transport system substrate-binding protein n=1 Tax=Paenibacillus endophyticus TaxID=1294268 RepID=A0A7W5C3D7_9BACL|nr:extracellular solute-binding protein [Paenibacillus endophyticus]MBB3150496.1 raffinose/stachyose/melibiose transport system substrate-binding protein [Paenibacillus endophyticus]
MKRKKLASLVLTAMISSAVLSACGSNNTNNASHNANNGAPTTEAAATASPDTKEPVELRIINWRVEDKEFFDQFNVKFEQENPNIKVRYDATPTQSYQQLKNSRIAANEVDIVAGDYKTMNSADQRELWMDLSGQSFLDNFKQDALQNLTYDSKQYGLPWNKVSLVAYYNKQIFSDLGLQEPKTWTEFTALLEKIKTAGIDPILVGGKDGWPMQQIVHTLEPSVVRGANSDFYGKDNSNVMALTSKFTDSEWLEVFTKFQTLSTYFQKNSLGLAYGQAPGLFAQGKAAMTIDGTFSLTQINDAKPNFEVGTFIVPATDDEAKNKIGYAKIGGAWFISNKSPNKEAALKYLEAFSQKDNYQLYIDTVNQFPVMDGITMKDPLAEQINDQLSAKDAVDQFTNIQNSGSTYSLDLLNKVSTGDMSPEEAAKQWQKDYEDSKANWK